ncbi:MULTISPECIES: F0F1 ATP synthase subunit epsilon [Brevibacterium]|uniref:ATP synthase epsilon chain n=1 Tax=Brevibacterium luteolum TaxID=199591 RepID=A0A6G8KVK6_9MICO|nr:MULTISPECIES: F0F1 ATP synthase subunit epsilon [Brevibacterium]MBM7528885.1 F-type H+-transporting ATPase subunit epsilon [Brevibacterium luteolum]MBU8577797.1 F0F1 ATP synthase subunit epsilon [Brevibacterium luteolum]MCT1657522.1 F0F1 ATP synthase subunit epsilon [Brevibacterium luteolum]MCT1830199.1 F0F1 ATP synthase subunit epsilon [Brevibacterium luteolum]MCT1873787.1 F0F1 ATP synthase subunit epsilon [Brevibacterium luteolum]
MSLNVTVVAADRSIWSGEAKRVVARTTEGEIGILTGHEPVLAIVAGGEVRIVTADDQTVRAQADGGFLSVENDRVNIVADQAELV